MSWKNVYKEFIEKDDLGVVVRKFEDAMENMSRDDMVEVTGMVTLAEEITGVKYEECQK